jgi:hypothetical protein
MNPGQMTGFFKWIVIIELVLMPVSSLAQDQAPVTASPQPPGAAVADGQYFADILVRIYKTDLTQRAKALLAKYQIAYPRLTGVNLTEDI